MRTLGIDPSLTSTGLALVDSGRIVELQRVRSKKTGYERVDEIWRAVADLARTAHVVAIEGTAMHAKGAAVVQIFGLWGFLTQSLWRAGRTPLVIPPSSRCLYATGRGNADKDEVLAAVIRRYQDPRIVGNDVADALIIAAMAARINGDPIEGSLLPEKNLKALEKVK